MHLGFGKEMGWDGGWVQFVEISSNAKKICCIKYIQKLYHIVTWCSRPDIASNNTFCQLRGTSKVTQKGI